MAVKQIYTVLPKATIEKIDALGLKKDYRNYAIKFVDRIIRNSMKEYRSIHGSVNMPSAYIRKIANSRYSVWLNTLLENDIVYTNGSYSAFEGTEFPKSYSIPLILSIPNISTTSNLSPYAYMSCDFKLNDFVSVSYDDLKYDLENEQKWASKLCLNDLKKLKIDSSKLYEILDKTIADLRIEDFKRNEEIRDEYITLTSYRDLKPKVMRIKRDKALSLSERYDLTLIEDNRKFYLMKTEDFIQMKKAYIYKSYKDSISKFEKKYYFAKRNNTNMRLDSNITNMANTLTDEICKQNELSKVDLSNSQFAILAYNLEGILDTEDYYMFREKAYDGTLYEYLQDVLNLKTRNESKKMLFELMFSKASNDSEEKKKLHSVFPSVVEYADSFKLKGKYKDFSISLQKLESEIFIDGVWKKIKNKKLFCLTKHDCLIYKKEDEEQVLQILNEYMKSINFKGKMVKG